VKWPPAWDPVELSVDKSSARAAVTRGPEELSLVKAVARKRLVETVIDRGY
jgi:hypothetical protein